MYNMFYIQCTYSRQENDCKQIDEKHHKTLVLSITGYTQVILNVMVIWNKQTEKCTW